MKKLIVSALIITTTLFACKTTKVAEKKPTIDCSTNQSVTFLADIKPIMDQYCTRCHNTNMRGGFNFQDELYVKKAAVSGQLLGSLKHKNGFDPMPAGMGGQMLDQAIIDKVECWINNGMK
jgi:mono/diheme cytochrome c family protein